jgi:hypothetical protein
MSMNQDGGSRSAARLLLDVRFQARATRSLLPFVYLGVLMLVALGGFCVVIAAAVQAWWLGLAALVMVPLIGLAVVAAARVGCELVLAVSELNEHVGGIADRFPHLEQVIDDLARDMPKLGFLRRGPNGRDRASADTEKVG